MKTLYLFVFLVLVLFSCGKKTTINGRVYNPVTNDGISGIEVRVTKPKSGLGYDGSGTKTVFTTTSDANGKFVIEERFRKSAKNEISESANQKDVASNNKVFQQKENLFSAFPNPNSGKFSVTFTGNQLGIVYAYSIQGKCMGSWGVENKSEVQLQQTDYKGLVFLAFISDKGEQLTTKIIIE